MGGDVFKDHCTLQALGLQSPIGLVGLNIQHRCHTTGACRRLGHGNNEICHLHQLHQDLGHIIIEGDDQSRGQHAVFHLPGAVVDKPYHRQIHQRKGQRIQQRGDPSRSILLLHQVSRTALKRRDFVRLFAESPEDPDACQILPGGGSDPIQASLNTLVHGHGDEHDAKDHHAEHRDQPHKNQCRLCINGECHDHGAENNEGRPQQQPQRQVHTVLQLIDV